MTRKLWTIGLLIVPRIALADAPDRDADAERLFREGQKLMVERRFGEACPKLEGAYRHDHQLGTLINLAYCHAEQGAPWQAWLEFKEAELKAIELKLPDRRDFARERMTELERTLARVAIDVAAGPKVELTDVFVEDRRVPQAEKGATFAAEPGQRKITFHAKGKKVVTQMVTLVRADRPQKLAVPELEDGEGEVAPPGDEETAPSPRPTQRNGNTERMLAYGIGGVGAIGVLLGSVAGIMTLGNDCTRAAKSHDPDACTREQKDRGDTTGTLADVGIIGGGLLLGTAAVLFLTAPRAKTAATLTDRRGRDTSLRGLTPVIAGRWVGLRGEF